MNLATLPQLSVTIHSGSHNMHKGTLPQLLSLKSVRLTSGEYCLEKNTQAQLKGYHSLGVTQHEFGDFTPAVSYHSLGVTQHAQGYFTSAIKSKKRALDIRRKLFGEEHSSTAERLPFTRGHTT